MKKIIKEIRYLREFALEYWGLSILILIGIVLVIVGILIPPPEIKIVSPNEMTKYSREDNNFGLGDICMELTLNENFDYESYMTHGGVFGTDSRDFYYYRTEENVLVKTENPCPHLVGRKVLMSGWVDDELCFHLLEVKKLIK